MKFSRTKKITVIALLSALAFLLSWLSNLLPPIFAVPPLGYDPKDIVITLGGFILGPIAALIVTVISCSLELTISSTGPIGLAMNILSSAAFSLTACIIFRYAPKIRRTFWGALVALLFAIVVQSSAMILWNWLITPLYLAVPRAAVIKMLVPVFLPFNIIKGSANAIGILLAFKPITRALKIQYKDI